MLYPNETQAEQLLDSLKQTVLQHFYHAEALNIFPSVSADELRQYLAQYTFAQPQDLHQTLAETVRNLQRWNVHITHPGYMGLFNPAVSFSSVVADMLASVFNPQLAAWSHAPFANEVERHTLRYIGGKIGLAVDDNFFANYTVGGSEANHTAVLVALAHAFPKYVQTGLVGLGTQPTVYVSAQAHNSFDKACKHAGIGTQALRFVPTTPDLKLDVSALKNMLAADRAAGCTPILVCGTAGTTAAGIIDPLPQLAALCRQENIWFHVDGAWAGAVVFSEKYKHAMQGMELADSITIDAHKWFSVPYGAGMFFTRHRAAADAAFGVTASYMPPNPAGIDNPFQTTVHWSRRFIGLKVFLTLCEWGAPGLRELVDRKIVLGERLRAALQQHGWTVLNHTPLPVVCFTHPRIESSAVSRKQVLETIWKNGNAWISEAVLNPTEKDPARYTRCLRACITNYKTTEKEVDVLVHELAAAIAG
jgi:glutamate/tyrosine decarboxylase-like PLP-dependent enzyme